MINVFTDIFAYEFLTRAIIVGALVSVCASLLGITLVLKRYSMIGDGLSHVGFGALSIAMALGFAPLKFAIPIVIVSAFLLLRLSENSKIKGDSAIALISTGSIAIGIISTSLTKGFNIDVYNFMFGSILSTSKSDVYISVALSLIVIILYVIFYNRIFAITFDESFAAASGINTKFYDMVLAFLTAITIVIGMRIMGTMLISSLIIFPALTSMQVFKTFKKVIICSTLVSLVCFFTGILLSYHFSLPAGASVVVVNIVFFGIFYIAGKVNFV
jgi:ABC-type Mn2+/Zn2+ transport system permease subunit